jgi:gliding motility-associated-like protein
LTCVLTSTDDDYTIANISPSVSPTVSIAAAPSTTICQGDTVLFTASAANTGSSPVYTWTINGAAAGINDSVLFATTLNDNDVVQVIVNSSLSCAPVISDTDNVVVTVMGNVIPSVVVSASSGAICAGDPVQFVALATNGGPAPAVQWTVNGVSTGLNNDTIILTTLNDGDTVQATITSSLGCVSPSSATSPVFIIDLQPYVTPQINISVSPNDTICIGEEVSLSATTVNGGTAPMINWYVNSIQVSAGSPSYISSTFGQGDIIVANVVSNAECLSQTTDTSNFVRILYYAPLDVQLSTGIPACPGVPVPIIAQPIGGNGGPYHIVWNDGSVDTDTIIVTPGRNTFIQVQINDNCSSVGATDTMTVPVLTGPIAEFSYVNPSPGSFYNDIQFINQSTDADSYLWFFPDSSTSTDLNPIFNFEEQGTYDVTLITTNNNGCIDSVTYHVRVHEEVAVYYPNSFTPNGDGRNELFQPLGASLEVYELTIWNRWGEMIYIGNQLMAWNGLIRNSGKPAPEGVYVFRIDLIDDKFEKRVVTGRVSLIR